MTARTPSTAARLPLFCGVVGAPFFVVVLLVEGALRPGYDPVYHSGSQLALGDRGWIQVTAFVVTGLLMLAFAHGVRRALVSWPAAVLIGVFGAGLIVAGVFPMDPMQGYPPGAPQGIPETTSLSHDLHDLAALPVFFGLAAACVAVAFRTTGLWRVYSLVTGVAVLVLFAVYGTLWTQDAANAGLVQRILIVTGWTWVTLLAARLLRRRPAARGVDPGAARSTP